MVFSLKYRHPRIGEGPVGVCQASVSSAMLRLGWFQMRR
jgi:hypothetical protein